MSRISIIEKLEKKHLKEGRGRFHVGDTVKVHTRIIEGEKERVQVFTGTVIARKGTGLSETFSVHRVAYGEGMERVFLLHSPRIAKIEVVIEGDVRRGKLYHLRGTSGKAAKIKRRIGPARRTSEQSFAEDGEFPQESEEFVEQSAEENSINEHGHPEDGKRVKTRGVAEEASAPAE